MAERNKNGTFSQGNSIAVKKWTLEEMEIVIENYFETCNKNILIVRGEKMSEPYTVEGLALALDLTMQGLWNYETAEGYEPFFETIKKAKLRIQGQKVLNGLIGRSNPVITIFDLKNNHGYKDKTEVDQTLTSVQPLQFKIIGKDE